MSRVSGIVSHDVRANEKRAVRPDAKRTARGACSAVSLATANAPVYRVVGNLADQSEVTPLGTGDRTAAEDHIGSDGRTDETRQQPGQPEVARHHAEPAEQTTENGDSRCRT